MKFIDLFSGIGGFHKALHNLGHECVYASEVDPILRIAYEKTWGVKPFGDIREIVKEDIISIPKHDILCAGFPCQPFSKAGKQEGTEDKLRGNLFDEILKILQFRKPTYFILENVPHLASHNNEETWLGMKKKLLKAGYSVDHEVYSPHQFGIPQHRERIFIVGSRIGLSHFSWLSPSHSKTHVSKIIDKNPKRVEKLQKDEIECLAIWQEFISALPPEIKIPGFPIWSMEFGATYPFETVIPFKLSAAELGKYKGSFGVSLKNLKKKEQIASLPSYSRVSSLFPPWKKRYIRSNRKFYIDNRRYVNEVVTKLAKYSSQSWQKLEWNVGDADRDILKYILQFRASGIRVKKNDFFPSLVCTNTQRPIIGWEKRYITREEGRKLQNLEGVCLPDNDNAAFRALGNAVNSLIVEKIAQNLLIEDSANVTKSFREIPASNEKKKDNVFVLAI